ncbi:short-chain dehydrogenase/reductase SDR, partial [Roridomyces roridus]
MRKCRVPRQSTPFVSSGSINIRQGIESNILEMSTDQSPVFLITGCSAGIGRELALAALVAGFRVIATARKLESLSDLESKGAKTLALDVTASDEDLAAVAAKAIAIYGQIDFLLSNAGYGQAGAIEEMTSTHVHAQFSTNFFGVVNTVNAFLPHFRQRRSGTLVQFSSENTCTTLPGTGIYTASKAAVEAVSDTWALELADFNIRSIVIQPSGFRTNFFNYAGAAYSGSPVKTIGGYNTAHGVIDFLINTFPKVVPGDPVKAARNIIKLLTTSETLPRRFVVGDDSYRNFKVFYEKRLEELELWKELSTGTNLD